jgi:hypothetical protein
MSEVHFLWFEQLLLQTDKFLTSDYAKLRIVLDHYGDTSLTLQITSLKTNTKIYQKRSIISEIAPADRYNLHDRFTLFMSCTEIVTIIFNLQKFVLADL